MPQIKRSKKNILIGFSLTFAALLLSFCFSYYSIKKLLNAQEWVIHTQEVIVTLEQITSRVVDAETGQRGFLLTNNEKFLEPTNNAQENTNELVTKVKQLTEDNPYQQKDFALLQRLIDRKFEIISSTLRDKRKGLQVSNDQIFIGKECMDSIRYQIVIMVERENSLMMYREKDLKTFTVMAPIVIVITAILGIILTVGYFQRLMRDKKALDRMTTELEEKEKKIQETIENVAKTANKIAEGDYNTRITNN